MLPRNLDGDIRAQQFQGQELANGIPTIAGLALLCSRTLAGLAPELPAAAGSRSGELSREAGTILAAAASRGLIEIRGRADAFDSSQRLLAVSVEVDEVHRLVFRSRIDPAVTMAYLEGFRQLCAEGLVLHQFSREFFLTSGGFTRARSLDRADFLQELEAAIEEEI